MRVGVIGLGYWGAKHVRVLSGIADVRQVVAYDVDRAKVAAMQASFPALATASDLPGLLDAVDAVVVATHPSTHATLAKSAILAGCHVLVEKPLALSSADAAAVVALAQRQRRVLMVGHTFAFNPAVKALADVVRSGDLGRVLHIDSRRLNLGIFQSDCDVIWDLAPHDVSIVNLLVGGAPTSVQTWGRGNITPGVVDNAYIMLNYDDHDTRAAVHVSWLDPHKVRQLTVVGSRRMAVYDDLVDDARLKIYDKGVTIPRQAPPSDAPMTYRHGDIHSPYIPFQEPLLLEDQHFVDCARRGAEPLTDGAAGMAVVKVLEAASVSLVEGREVHLAEFADLPTVHVDLRRRFARLG